MIDRDFQQLVAPSVNWPVDWQRWDVEFAEPPMEVNAFRGAGSFIQVAVPHSLAVAYALAYVTRRNPFARNTLKVIGATIGNRVYLNINPEMMNTAAGQALAAHEFWHVKQKQEMPDFDYMYNQYAEQTPSDQPWKHPLEYPAYVVECRVWRSLVKQGWPKGPWTPLGASIGLC